MEATTPRTTTNRFPGSCGRCGAKVPAEAGYYTRNEGVTHVTEDECKKTTKTWKTFENHRRFNQARTDVVAAWVAAGFKNAPEFDPSTAMFDSGTHVYGTIDGTHVRVVTGNMRWEDKDGWNTVRVMVGQMEAGRFMLDRDAIKAAEDAYEGEDLHRKTVLAAEAKIAQVLAGIEHILHPEA